MKSAEIGTIWINVEKCKYGNQFWMKVAHGWKFIGYNKNNGSFPTENSMKRFLRRPHFKDIKDPPK
jgi:hypothetical protein